MLCADSSPKFSRARSAPSRPACHANRRFLRLFFLASLDPENRGEGIERKLKIARKRGCKISIFWGKVLRCSTLNTDFRRARSNRQNDGCSRRQGRVDCPRSDKHTARHSTRTLNTITSASQPASEQAHSHVGKSACSGPGKTMRVDAKYAATVSVGDPL